MPSATALLAQSANYRLELELRLADAIPSLVEIQIRSWYLDARDPKSPQVRFRTMSSPDALARLKSAIEVVLTAFGGIHREGGR